MVIVHLNTYPMTCSVDEKISLPANFSTIQRWFRADGLDVFENLNNVPGSALSGRAGWNFK